MVWGLFLFLGWLCLALSRFQPEKCQEYFVGFMLETVDVPLEAIHGAYEEAIQNGLRWAGFFGAREARYPPGLLKEKTEPFFFLGGASRGSVQTWNCR